MIDLLLETHLKAGYVIYFIFFVSLYAWFLIIKKYYIVKAEVKDASGFIKKLTGLFNADSSGKLIQFLEGENRIIGRVLLDVLRINNRVDIKKEVEGLRLHYFGDLDNNIGTISALAAIAPLLGLLGTVLGMMKTFGVIKLFGSANPSLMAEGISEALLTTQAGLVVAFPILLANTFLKNRIKEIKDTFEKTFIRLIG